MTDSCGHEWVVSITQQTEEPDLDHALFCVMDELPGVEKFAVYVNKYFDNDIPPTLLNKNTQLKPLDTHDITSILSKVAKNKTCISNAPGCYTSYIPLYYLSNVIGFLWVESSHQLAQSTNTLAIHVLNVYANQLALVHRSRLDPLSELLNRQTFDKKVIEIVYAEDFNPSVGDSINHQSWFLAMLDIDHFKRVNDQFGHVIGDEVILLVSRLLKDSFSIEDALFRYGGEEFAVLFQAPDENAARALLDRVRENIAKYPFPQISTLTVSVGFLQLNEQCMVSSLVHKADLALYHSKNNGRNKVTAYSALNLVQQRNADEGNIVLF